MRHPAFWCGIAAFGLLAPFVGTHAFPGEPARTMAEHAGLAPFMPVLHPLWSLLAHAASALPAAMPLALSMNLLGALCGALSAVLLYHLSVSLPLAAAARAPEAMRRGAAFVAGLALVLVPSVFAACTRGTPAALELLLLLAWLACVQRFHHTRLRRWALLAALAAGPLALELTAFPVLALAVGLMLAITIVRRLRQPWGLLAGCVILGVASIALACLLMAWVYAHLPVNAWRTNLDVPTVLLAILRQQWVLTRHVCLGSGWIIVLLLMIAPWVAAVLVARQEEPVSVAALWSWALIAALAWVPALVMLDTTLTPSRLIGPVGAFLPYALFTASTFGLVGLLVCDRLKPLRWEPERWCAVTGPVLAAGAVFLGAASVIRQAPALAPHRADAVAAWTDATLDSLEGRAWLVTDGLMDDLLRLAARDAGQPLTLLDLSRARDEVYAAYLAHVVAEPRLQALARVGLVPLLRDWMQHAPDIGDTLAIQPQPDLWLAARMAFVPSGTVYLGSRAPDRLDPAELVAREGRVLHTLLLRLTRTAAGPPDVTARVAAALLAGLGRHANNLGLALENLGDPTRAGWAYAQALAADSRNICARVNLAQLTHPRATDGEDLATALAANAATPLPLLLARYGHVRNAEALALLRPTLIRSHGRAERRDAASLQHPGSQRSPLPEIDLPAQSNDLRAVADAYLAGHKDEARAALESALRADASRTEAWVLLGVLAYAQDDTQTVRRCVNEVRRLKQEAVPLLIVQGNLHARAGERAEARRVFERAQALDPRRLEALEALLALDLEERAPISDVRLRAILTQDPDHALANFALGVACFREGNTALAESALRRSLERQPLPDALNNLAWILQARGDLAAALPLAEQAVVLAPQLAAAWDTRGVILTRLGRFDEAGAALDQALALAPADAETRRHHAEWKRLTATP